MLQWTAAWPGARFMGIVHHTDAEREYAYDRNSHIGRLDKALDEARKRNWTVVDMPEIDDRSAKRAATSRQHKAGEFEVAAGGATLAQVAALR